MSTTQPTPDPQSAGTPLGGPLPGGRVVLAVAVALFLGWLAWIGYAAANKSRAPIVSRAQAAAAAAAVVAEVQPGAANATVVEKLWGDGPDGAVAVPNLGDAHGLAGPGRYLLYLSPHHDGTWRVVGQQRSPGNDLSSAGKPLVYPWTDDVRKQAERLKR